MTPEQIRLQRETDEARTRLIDEIPEFWFGLFVKMKEVGFTEHQAMEILKTFVSSMTGGIK